MIISDDYDSFHKTDRSSWYSLLLKQVFIRVGLRWPAIIIVDCLTEVLLNRC